MIQELEARGNMSKRTILITGAAGNLGGFLARHLAGGDLQLRLMEHTTAVGGDLRAQPNVGRRGRSYDLAHFGDGVTICQERDQEDVATSRGDGVTIYQVPS